MRLVIKKRPLHLLMYCTEGADPTYASCIIVACSKVTCCLIAPYMLPWLLCSALAIYTFSRLFGMYPVASERLHTVYEGPAVHQMPPHLFPQQHRLIHERVQCAVLGENDLTRCSVVHVNESQFEEVPVK